MAAKPRKKSRNRITPNAAQTSSGTQAWFNYVNSGTIKNLTLAAAAVGAIFYLNSNVFKPIYDSGPPPFPSRTELKELQTETTSNFDGIKKGLDETLEVAKAANVAAQQSVQESRDARTTRLLQLKLELEARLKNMPNDSVINDMYARTLSDLARLTAMPPTAQATSSAVK